MISMAEEVENIVDESEFLKHYSEQVESKSQKDIFFIWLLIMFISVIAAHFVLNFTGSSPTGFVTATQNPTENITLLFDAMMVVFVVVLITALIYMGISKKDH
jgi:hypothetical protein